jgi:hypothetical protein
VIRSAASKCLDLICVDRESVSGLEVKSTRDNTLYVSRTRRQQEQHAELCRINDETVAGTAYVVRWEPEGVYEVFWCFETIMRRGHGVSLDIVFPGLRSAPNNPPIVPRKETLAQVCKDHAEGHADKYGCDDRDGQGGGTD